MHDKLPDCGTFRLFNAINEFNQEALHIEIELTLPSARVIKALERIIALRETPAAISCNTSP